MIHIPPFNFNEMARIVAQMREHQGWSPVTMENLESRMLMSVSEVCEMQLHLRQGHDPANMWQLQSPEADAPPDAPEGFPIEVADAIFRLLDIAHCLGIDLDKAVWMKMVHNFSKPSKRGRLY